MPAIERVANAIAQAVAEGEIDERSKGGFVLGFFAIVEVATPDGDRWLNWVWSDGMKSWQMRGYLTEALESQQQHEIQDGFD